MHKSHKELPGPDRDSETWHAFVLACSSAGPEGIPPIVVTPLGEIMDGERRWLAARQLQWDRIGVIRRPETEAASIIVDSLMGQRHLTKGAKIYLILPLLEDFVESAERRRLANLKQGTKTIEKALIFPKSTERTSGKGWDDLAERFGVGRTLFFQALQVRRLFTLTASHKFEFQDGRQRTLKDHFEPQLLDAESPMGLGEILKGCGWFVDENGNPKKQLPPPDRNSHLHYFEHAWGNFSKQWERWEKLKTTERARALEIMTAGVREWPGEVREELARAIKRSNQ
jgi:hypothetical protein